MLKVFVDTSVLFPFSVMDLLLALTEDGVHAVVWTDELLDEWERVIVREQRLEGDEARSSAFLSICEIGKALHGATGEIGAWARGISPPHRSREHCLQAAALFIGHPSGHNDPLATDEGRTAPDRGHGRLCAAVNRY